MLISLTTLLTTLSSIFHSRAALQLENLALRHQIGVLQRSSRKRPKLTLVDRLLWVWLSRIWSGWQSALALVKPETVVAWHRKGFRLFWTWKVRHGQPGRPIISREVRDLIRKMCRENLSWGAPRIHGELLKLGINIGESSVSKYMVRSRKPPSQTWRTFLENHAQQLVSIDFFTVPTLRFQVLYVFLVLAHDRRRILHFNGTAHPTAEWTGQQLREAFPFDQLPRYLLRDRDRIFGDDFRGQVRDMGICEVLSAPHSPWQRAYVERVIGSIRRECLDHVIVLHENALRRTLNSYFDYYHRSRTHLSLRKDSPEPRAIQPPEMGTIVTVPQVGGLHHRYERRAT
jgi:putative transposase